MMRTVVASMFVSAAMSSAVTWATIHSVRPRPEDMRCDGDQFSVCRRAEATWSTVEKAGEFMNAMSKSIDDAESRIDRLELGSVGWAKAGKHDGRWHCLVAPREATKGACLPTGLLCSVAAAASDGACFEMSEAYCTEGARITTCYMTEGPCKQNTPTGVCTKTAAFDAEPVLELMRAKQQDHAASP
jgi:hypothetical protein